MEITAFESLKSQFKRANTDEKISIYCETYGLTQFQYKELLKMFPLSDLDKLEAALG